MLMPMECTVYKYIPLLFLSLLLQMKVYDNSLWRMTTNYAILEWSEATCLTTQVCCFNPALHSDIITYMCGTLILVLGRGSLFDPAHQRSIADKSPVDLVDHLYLDGQCLNKIGLVNSIIVQLMII